MNTRGIVNKRIVAIHQHRRGDGRGKTRTDVVAIELENGIRMIPMTIETDVGDYFHDFIIDESRRKA